MSYVPLHPEFLQNCIENYEDTITEQHQKDIERCTESSCPRCGGKCIAKANVDQMLRQGSTRYAYLAECIECGCLHNPDSGIIVELGNLGRLEPAIPIVRPAED